jgi:hypothetical protein
MIVETLKKSVKHDKDAATMEKFNAVLSGALIQGNLRGMKLAKNDLIAMAEDLPGPIKAELDQKLTESFGAGLKTHLPKILNVIHSGKITTEFQYRLLSDYLETILHDDLKQKECLQVGEMIDRFNIDRGNKRRGLRKM